MALGEVIVRGNSSMWLMCSLIRLKGSWVFASLFIERRKPGASSCELRSSAASRSHLLLSQSLSPPLSSSKHIPIVTLAYQQTTHHHPHHPRPFPVSSSSARANPPPPPPPPHPAGRPSSSYNLASRRRRRRPLRPQQPSSFATCEELRARVSDHRGPRRHRG